MTMLRRFGLIIAVLAAWAPFAHLLELPNKLRLDGPLWLAVQQQLYRGWGPLLGGPAEIAALLTTLALLIWRWRHPVERNLTILAAAAYGAMLAVFFLANDPVNKAVASWTAGDLPSDWPRYRLLWEAGHALAALLSAVALAALWDAWRRERIVQS